MQKKISFFVLALLLSLALSSDAFVRHRVVGGVPAAGGCDPASEEVGERSVLASSSGFANNAAYCTRASASCSGTLADGYYYNADSSTNDLRIAIYSDDGDNVPDSGDSLIGDTGSFSTGGVNNWVSASIGSGSVTASSVYWVCVFTPSSTLAYQYSNGTATETYEDTGKNCLASGCADLTAVSGWSEFGGNRNISKYAEIGP